MATLFVDAPRRRRRLLNEDKSRTSMDDDDTWSAVGELLEAFRATHTVPPRESPLAPRAAPPEAPPAMSLTEDEQVEQAPGSTPTAAAAVAASSAADSAPLAGASNAFGALLDRLSPEGGAKADADGAADGPGTPSESAPASPARSGPLVRRWSARLSASMRKAGEELREALDKL